MNKSKIIISYPFSGSLYGFFENVLYNRHLDYKEITHPYYKTLLGRNFIESRELALTLTILFDEIIIPPADAALPDRYKFSDKEFYNNQDLGLICDWNNVKIFDPELNDIIDYELQDKIILSLLSKVPKHAQRQILFEVHSELKLSEIHNCPVISSPGRKNILNRIFEINNNKDNNYNIDNSDAKVNLKLLESYIRLIGLTFTPLNLDELYKIKNEKEVRFYANSFVDVLSGYKISNSSNEDLKKLIRESRESEKVFKNASGFFDAASLILSIVSFFVPYGDITSIGSLASTAISYDMKNEYEKSRWYEFGYKIKLYRDKYQFDKLIE